MIDKKELFDALIKAPHETAVSKVLDRFGLACQPEVWTPYGDTESNYAIVENQQSHAVPALVEKITNGIDAILERRCLEEGIDPRSSEAPHSVSEAIERFFPEHKNWDILGKRREQALDLQIVADGPKNNTSLFVYDNGIGQKPDDFPSTFMSLVCGNKNDVHFVQGKYNMGGAGALIFCGRSRFQLVVSRRFGGSKRVGFTLLRRHPLTEDEASRKSTWYEYLVFDGRIPSFKTGDIDIGLSERNFGSGSFLKLYSYRLPPGTSMIQRDLNLSLNEYLFRPALPFLTVEKIERYPKNKELVTQSFGLCQRIEENDETVEDRFTLSSQKEADFGRLNVRVYVFKTCARGKNAKESRKYIRNEYFKNNMSVLFSLSGQVQGHYTAEFISRTLKMNLLRDYVLIHVDCSELRTEVRNELFMASRDRLKLGDESKKLRDHLRDILIDDGRLKKIEKHRRANLGASGADVNEFVQNIAKRIPMNPGMNRLLKKTLEIPDVRGRQNKPGNRPSKVTVAPDISTRTKPAFDPQRYPSIFNLQGGDGFEGEMTLFRLPRGGKRTIRFSTDVEDRYFDRAEDAGEMQIDILRLSNEESARDGNREEGARDGSNKADIGRHDRTLDVITSSPSSGQIRVTLSANKNLSVGNAVKIRASLSSAGEPLVQTFIVRISEVEPEKPAQPPNKPEPNLGMPKMILVSKKGGENRKSWIDVEKIGISMNHNVVVEIVPDGEKLSEIVINMDSRVLQDFRRNIKSEEQYKLVERRYISDVYSHCLFIFATTTKRKYELKRIVDDQEQFVDINNYVADLFQQSYAEFLLNFSIEAMEYTDE